MISFVKEGSAIFMIKGSQKIGIPKNAWILPHPTQANMIVITDRPRYDGVNGIVVPQADVSMPSSSDVNDLITKLHRDFFPDAVGVFTPTAELLKAGYWQYPMLVNNTNNTSTYMLTANTLHAFPFVLDSDVTFKQFGVRCLTNGNVSNRIGIGIYKAGDKNSLGDRYVPHELLTIDNNGTPFSFRYEAQPQNATLILSFPSFVSIPKGLYFLAMNCNVNVNVRGGNGNIRKTYGAGLTTMGDFPISRLLSNTGAVAYNATDFGLPATCPILPNKSGNAIIPYFGLKYE